MKKLILFITIAICYIPDYASTTISGGNVYGTWTLAGSPYFIKDNVTVPDDSVLTIQPGVIVRVDSAKSIYVNGTIKAIGTTTSRIRFSASDTTTNGTLTLKGWYGLRFSDAGTLYNNDTSVLKYCIIEHAKMSLVTVLSFNKLIIERCIFRKGYGNNGGALNIQGSNIKVLNNTIYDNYTDYGGSVQLYHANSYLSGNIISNNRSLSGGAGVYIQDNSNSSFYNNIICNNTCIAGSASSDGAGIIIIASTPEFYNCDIVNNYSGFHAGGILFRDNSDATFVNCIIYGNTSALSADTNVYLTDNYSDPNFYNCDVKGGTSAFKKNPGVTYTGIYLNNRNVLPSFNAPSGGAGYSFNGTAANWRLLSSSTLVNKGKPGSETKLPSLDFYGNKRLYYGVLDMGAAEYNNKSITVTGDITISTIWYADTVNLQMNDSITIMDGADLTIPPGVIVKSFYHYPLLVKGALIAIGTAESRIKFTYSDTTGFTKTRLSDAFQTWKGIWFINPADGSMFNNDTSKIIYCDIEYVKNSGTKTWDGGIYVTNYQQVIVQNTRLMHNTGRSHGALVLTYNSDILFDNNELFDNMISTTGKGAGIYVDGADPIISNNNIHNNSNCDNGTGIYLSRFNGKLFNNTITNNTSNASGAGAYLYNCDLAFIYNNVIQNNQTSAGTGGGIYIDGNLRYFFNNTVAYNKAKTHGGGISANGNDVFIFNSVLFGNSPEQIYLGSTLNNLNIYNSDFQGGKDAFYYALSPIYYVISYLNNLDQNPGFKLPPLSAGTSSNGLATNLSLTCISPCINKGANTIDGAVMPDIDKLNNPRIAADTIDMGAYEDVPSQVQITVQPKGKLLCKYDNITISVSTKDVANYQWQKDGVDITGANKASYFITSIDEDGEGNYICIASNAYSKAFSNPAFLKVWTAPEITDQPSSSLIYKNSSVTLIAKADGTKPIDHKWTKDGVVLPDTAFKLYIDSFKTGNEGTYVCEMTNACGSVITDAAVLSLAPSICMVTVSTPYPGEKGHNLVVFEKESKIQYTDFKIYRESEVAGYYYNIGTVPADQEGLFLDSIVDPKEQAYLYKITGVKDDRTETDINSCLIHKPIHLLTTRGEAGGIQLDWDQYIGFNYSTYFIYRKSSNEDTFTMVHSMSSSTRTWTDDTVVGINDTLFYYISVVKTGGCYPAGSRKGGSDIYSQSVSNLEDNRLRSSGISKAENNAFNFSCYPNPLNSYATILYTLETPVLVKIELFNTVGSKIAIIENKKLQAGTYKYKLNAQKLNLNSGIYILKFNAGSKSLERMLVITK